MNKQVRRASDQVGSRCFIGVGVSHGRLGVRIGRARHTQCPNLASVHVDELWGACLYPLLLPQGKVDCTQMHPVLPSLGLVLILRLQNDNLIFP